MLLRSLARSGLAQRRCRSRRRPRPLACSSSPLLDEASGVEALAAPWTRRPGPAPPPSRALARSLAPSRPALPPDPAPWTGGVPFTTAFLLVWFGFGYALPSALHGATASSPTELASLQLGLESLKAGATAWLCLSSPFRPPRAWLALDAAPRQPAAATAALAAAGALACTLFATLASLGAHGGMSPSPPPEAVALALQPASALAAVAVAPLVEEAVFRGVLQRSLLAAGVAPPLAVAAQAAAFAGLHLGRGGWDAAGLLGVGAALGATAAAAAAGGGGLAVPVCAHALFNAGALASLARGG